MELSERELFEKVPVPRAVARLIEPTIISQIVTVIYNLADTFFIGRIGDPTMVAGVTLVMYFFQSMRILGKNMAYLLRCKEIARERGFFPPPKEENVYTNFIRE